MKTVIKFELDTDKRPEITDEQRIELETLFNGKIPQYAAINTICNECESRNAGKDYCDACKQTQYSLFAL